MRFTRVALAALFALQSAGPAFGQSVASVARSAGTGVVVPAVLGQPTLPVSPAPNTITNLTLGAILTPRSIVRAQSLAAASVENPVESVQPLAVTAAGIVRQAAAVSPERLGGAHARVERTLLEAAYFAGAPAAEPDMASASKRSRLASVYEHLTHPKAGHALHHFRDGGDKEKEAERARALVKVVGVGLSFAAIEALGAWFTGSVALRADAMHLLLDTLVSAGALLAMWLARRPTEPGKPSRFAKAEPIIGLIAAVAIGLTAIEIGQEAWERFGSPVAVSPITMLLALSGLAANVINAFLLRKYRDDGLSMKSAFLHALTDAVGSIGIILSGLAVYFLNWIWADAAIAGVIVSLIVLTAGNLARSSWKALKAPLPPSPNPR